MPYKELSYSQTYDRKQLGHCTTPNNHKMLRITAWVLLGVLGWDFVSCSITCPDGKVCSDVSTCCMTTYGYACCAYPNAVCCPDLKHCCPSGFSCNLVSQMCEQQDRPWMGVPMMKKVAAEEPSAPVLPFSPLQELDRGLVPEHSEGEKSSVVRCDMYYFCPDGTTCCSHPAGGWYCCAYSPAWCCLDGVHCCPYGYNCDRSYQYCVREGPSYAFFQRQAPASVAASYISTPAEKGSLHETPMTALTEASAEVGVIRCDAKFFCPAGRSCCMGETGQWSCCPYPLAKCCSDGKHCCEYEYTCDSTSMTCRKWYSQVPSGRKESARQG